MIYIISFAVYLLIGLVLITLKNRRYKSLGVSISTAEYIFILIAWIFIVDLVIEEIQE